MTLNSLEILKLVSSFLTPVVVLIIGYIINKNLKERDIKVQKELDLEREERQRRYNDEERKYRDEIERRHEPHIELGMECDFFGPREDNFLANIKLTAHNRGYVVHKFPKVKLRIRGIKSEPFTQWKEREPRAFFPHEIVKTDLVPPGYKFIFVEPGVSHEISMTMPMSSEYAYILVFVEFEYKKYWPHSIEKVFQLPIMNK